MEGPRDNMAHFHFTLNT